MKNPESTIIALGDIHGELESLTKILRHAEVMDRDGRWTGGERTLVQTGDVIDRGTESPECYELLARLQSDAARAGGRVLRLAGNHEMELLQGFPLDRFPGWEALRERLRHDVLSGNVLGACAGQGYLFVHAGVRSEMRSHLLGGVEGAGPRAMAVSLAERINRILVDAATRGDFGDPIFRAGKSRGGSHDVGGIFWESERPMRSSADACRVRQVFGHTPQRDGIRLDPRNRLINIDVGIHYIREKLFGVGEQNLAYLVLEGGQPRPVVVH